MTETTTPSVEGDRLEALRICQREVQGFDGMNAGTKTDIHRAVLSALPCKGGEDTERLEGIAAYLAEGSPRSALYLQRLARRLATPTTEPDTVRGLREAAQALYDNIAQAWPGLVHLKPMTDLLAALSDTPSGREISEVETHRADDASRSPSADIEGALLSSLCAMVTRYVELANSGDAGNWDPEIIPDVINARAAIMLALTDGRPNGRSTPDASPAHENPSNVEKQA